MRLLRCRIETSCRATLAALACLTWGCSSSESQGGAPGAEAGSGDATYPEGGFPTGDASQPLPDGGPGLDGANGGLDGSDGGSDIVVDGGRSVTLMTHTDHPDNLVVDSANVYWIDMASETVRKAPRAGGPMTEIASGEIELSGIAVDANNVYWSLNLTGEIRKAPVSGGPPTTLLTIPTPPAAGGIADIGALSIDATSAYWTDGHAILSAPLTGGPITTVFAGGIGYLCNPVLFGGSLHYCSTDDSSGTFYRVPVTGGSTTNLGALGNSARLFTVSTEGVFAAVTDIYLIPAAGLPPNTLPTDLVSLTFGPSAITTDSTSIYWATDTISKAPKSGVPAGSSPATLASGQGSVSGMVADGANLYWTDWERATVKSVPTAGGSVTTLWVGANSAHALAIDGTNLYAAYQSGSVFQIPLNGGAPTTIMQDGDDASYIATDGKNVYWMGLYGHAIAQAPVGGGPSVPVASPSAGSGLVVDATNLYWVDGGKLQRRPLAGGSIAALGAVPGFVEAVTSDANNVYCASQVQTSTIITKAPKNGNPSTQLATSSGKSSAIAVDAVNVYWTNPDNHQVMILALSGGVATAIPGGQSPSSLALAGAYLYWNDISGLMRVRVTGGTGTPETVLPKFAWPAALLSDGKNIYWAENSSGTVGRWSPN
jgi:hypothetical protein